MTRLRVAIMAIVVSVCLPVAFQTPEVHAQPDRSCSGPGEPSFTCGFVVVTVQVGSDVETVLAACQPVGTVSDASGRDFLISASL